MFSLSTIPGKMSLPMNGIKQPTKRKLKIFGLPLSTLLIGRELALLNFCNVLLMTIDCFYKNSNGDDRNEDFFFILTMPYPPPARIWSVDMRLILSI